MRRDVSLIILYDTEKNILLQHRDTNIQFAPDHWAFFGGGIDAGETPEQALAREAYEELRYHVRNPTLVIAQQYQNFGRTGIKYVHAEECLDKTCLELHEGQGWGWFSVKETQHLKMTDTDRAVLGVLDRFLKQFLPK